MHQQKETLKQMLMNYQLISNIEDPNSKNILNNTVKLIPNKDVQNKKTYRVDKENISANHNKETRTKKEDTKNLIQQLKQINKKDNFNENLCSYQANLVIQKQRAKIAVLLKMLNELHCQQIASQQDIKKQREQYKEKFLQLSQTNIKMNQFIEQLQIVIKNLQNQYPHENQKSQIVFQPKQFQQQSIKRILTRQQKIQENKETMKKLLNEKKQKMTFVCSIIQQKVQSIKNIEEAKNDIKQSLIFKLNKIQQIQSNNSIQNQINKFQISKKFSEQNDQQNLQDILSRISKKMNELQEQITFQKKSYSELQDKYQNLKNLNESQKLQKNISLSYQKIKQIKQLNSSSNHKHQKLQQQDKVQEDYQSTTKQNRKIIIQNLILKNQANKMQNKSQSLFKKKENNQKNCHIEMLGKKIR